MRGLLPPLAGEDGASAAQRACLTLPARERGRLSDSGRRVAVLGCSRARRRADRRAVLQGRQVSIVVGFNPGGAYDPYARAVARHLPRHLPGSPTIVVKNMQGAGSVIAANHLYNVSPRDGSELGVIAGSAALEPVYGKKTAQFDGRHFTWLGSANEEIAGCLAWHTSPFKTVEDLFKQEMITGASGASNLEFPTAHERGARHQDEARARLPRPGQHPARARARRGAGHVRHGQHHRRHAAAGLAARRQGAHPGADRARAHRAHGRPAVRDGLRQERGRQARAAA